SQRQYLISGLQQIGNVKSVQYISKDKALSIYVEQNSNNKELLTAVSETNNPLPASLVMKPKDANDLSSIKSYLVQPNIKVLQSDPTSYSGDRKQAIDK